MEASPISSPAPSSSSFSSSSSKLKYRLNCRGKEDLFLFKPIGPVPLLCRITLLIRSLPSVLLLKPSVFGTAPKDTVLRRGFTGAARQTTGILKAQSKLTAHRVERTINRARSSSLLAAMTELQADDSSSVAGKPVADLACSFILILHFYTCFTLACSFIVLHKLYSCLDLAPLYALTIKLCLCFATAAVKKQRSRQGISPQYQ